MGQDQERYCFNKTQCPPDENDKLIKIAPNDKCIDKCSNDNNYRY